MKKNQSHDTSDIDNLTKANSTFDMDSQPNTNNFLALMSKERKEKKEAIAANIHVTDLSLDWLYQNFHAHMTTGNQQQNKIKSLIVF